jgi:hypothetical protein
VGVDCKECSVLGPGWISGLAGTAPPCPAPALSPPRTPSGIGQLGWRLLGSSLAGPCPAPLPRAAHPLSVGQLPWRLLGSSLPSGVRL